MDFGWYHSTTNRNENFYSEFKDLALENKKFRRTPTIFKKETSSLNCNILPRDIIAAI